MQGLSLLHVDPLQLLVGIKTVAGEMFVFAAISEKPYPVTMIYAVFVEYDAVVLEVRQQLAQVFELRQLGIFDELGVVSQYLANIRVRQRLVNKLNDWYIYINLDRPSLSKVVFQCVSDFCY